MLTFIVSSEIARRELIKKASSIGEVIQWVENTLDLSQNWKIEESKIAL